MQNAFIVMMFVPLILFCFSYVYFMLNDPDKLRSEEYELRRVALSLIEEKGGSIPLSEASVEAISNADYRQLPKLAPEGGQ